MKKEKFLEIKEMNYTVFYLTDSKYTPWVAAYGYHEKEDYWAQGHYFVEFKECLNYLIETAKETGNENNLYRALELKLVEGERISTKNS